MFSIGMKSLLRAALPLGAALVIAFPAVAQEPKASGGTTPVCPVGGYPMIACPVTTDEVIQGMIAARLAGTVVLGPADVVQVAVCNGVATLTGQLSDQLRKETAGLLASQIRGVVSVQNQIRVASLIPQDLALVERVRRQLDRALGSYNTVQVRAANGVVQLSGYVSSYLERDIAEVAAGSVKGVTSVHNNIFVKGGVDGGF